MSPGARTIPAAMVLPTAAEIPNHIPSTFSSRPPLLAALTASKLPLDAPAVSVEDRSDGLSNWWSLRNFRNFLWELRHNRARGRKCKLELRSMRGRVDTDQPETQVKTAAHSAAASGDNVEV